MAIVLKLDNEDRLSLHEFVDHLETTFDLEEADSLIGVAPHFRALANDPDLIAYHFNAEIQYVLNAKNEQRHVSSPLVIADAPNYCLQAKIWMPDAQADALRPPSGLASGARLAHNHNFKVMTIGYFGPGHIADLYVFNPKVGGREIGDRADLRFTERVRIRKNCAVICRETVDAHAHVAPEALSISMSLSIFSAGQAGFDVRYDISPEMAAVVTVNPDFAEAEVDAQQINLTPYALFKPEKRAFFLDGSNQFTFASGIGSIFIPFYSRTIGLVDATPVRIDEGVKLIGQSGPLSVGALAVRSGDSVVSDPRNLFAGRLAYDVDEHLRIGTLLTDGDPTGQSRNRFEGLDSVWRTATMFGDKNLNVSAWAARSSGDDKPGQHAGWGTYIDYPNDLWRWVISANTFGDALDPAMGFLPRPGTHQYDLYLGHFPRSHSDDAWVHQYFYELELEQVDDLAGTTESRKLTVTPFNVLTESAEHFEVHWSPQYEFLSQPFAITDRVTLPAGQYHFQRVHFQAESSTADAFQAGAQLEVGGFYDGTLLQAIPYVRWTSPDSKWRFEFNNETDAGHLREGNFVQRLYQLKASYSFDANFAFSSFTQFDTDTHRVGLNAQLRWMIAPQRDLFFVFNHQVAPALLEPNTLYTPLSNSLTIKLQWSFYK